MIYIRPQRVYKSTSDSGRREHSELTNINAGDHYQLSIETPNGTVFDESTKQLAFSARFFESTGEDITEQLQKAAFTPTWYINNKKAPSELIRNNGYTIVLPSNKYPSFDTTLSLHAKSGDILLALVDPQDRSVFRRFIDEGAILSVLLTKQCNITNKSTLLKPVFDRIEFVNTDLLKVVNLKADLSAINTALASKANATELSKYAVKTDVTEALKATDSKVDEKENVSTVHRYVNTIQGYFDEINKSLCDTSVKSLSDDGIATVYRKTSCVTFPPIVSVTGRIDPPQSYRTVQIPLALKRDLKRVESNVTRVDSNVTRIDNEVKKLNPTKATNILLHQANGGGRYYYITDNTIQYIYVYPGSNTDYVIYLPFSSHIYSDYIIRIQTLRNTTATIRFRESNAYFIGGTEKGDSDYLPRNTYAEYHCTWENGSTQEWVARKMALTI